MAAYVVCPTDLEWKYIQPFLAECRQGAIVVPPDVQAAFKEKWKISLEDAIEAQERRGADFKPMSYDFGGDADLRLDIPPALTSFGMQAILDELGLKDSFHDDSEMP